MGWHERIRNPNARRRLAAAMSGWCCAGLLWWPYPADAGAPFLTEDPEPIELGHYEVYLFSMGFASARGTFGFLPAFEFNYGLIPEGQIHFQAPLSFNTGGGSTHFGYGDTELGFKYRFVQEDKNGWIPQVGTYPLLELPTGDETRGLGAGHVRALLPIWLQKSFGDWTTFGGGGLWLNRSVATGDQDFWFFGWALQRKVTEKWSVGGEIFHATADKIGGKDVTGFNLGALYRIDDHHQFLFSTGRGIQNASERDRFSWYIGYQITGP